MTAAPDDKAKAASDKILRIADSSHRVEGVERPLNVVGDRQVTQDEAFGWPAPVQNKKPTSGDDDRGLMTDPRPGCAGGVTKP
ncbi:MAG: hypothetical protein HOV83_18310 [Catenulispora sp.]|nr:hypothetical protein [Catenulispora sp.]